MKHTFMVKHNNERPGNVAIGATESKVFENLPQPRRSQEITLRHDKTVWRREVFIKFRL